MGFVKLNPSYRLEFLPFRMNSRGAGDVGSVEIVKSVRNVESVKDRENR
jgi:hypothetical protein